MDDFDLDLQGDFVFLLISEPLQYIVWTSYVQINAVLPNSWKKCIILG